MKKHTKFVYDAGQVAMVFERDQVADKGHFIMLPSTHMFMDRKSLEVMRNALNEILQDWER